jgi:hypothetical protein
MHRHPTLRRRLLRACVVAAIVAGCILFSLCVARANGADWASPPRAAWWRTETLAKVRGNAGSHCAEDGVCIGWGQGMAFSVEGGGSRVALPMVSTGLLDR